MTGTAASGGSDRPTPREVAVWAHIRPSKIGSFERYMRAMAEAAPAAGFAPHFYVRERVPDEIADYLRDGGVQWTELSAAALSSPGELRARLGERPARITNFHFFSLCERLYFVPRRVGSRAILSARLSFDSGARETDGPVAAIKRLRRRLYASGLDLITTNSRYVAGRLAEAASLPDKMLMVNYNGVDAATLRPAADAAERDRLRRELLGVEPGTTVVTYVGQIEPYKGMTDMFAALDRLRGDSSSPCFVFVGVGSMADDPRLNQPDVRFLGLRDDVPSILRASDIFWAPSRWQEAFGFTIAEASATELPVVATRVGGIPEVVEEGATGYLVSPADPPALAERVSELLAAPDLRRRMGRAGRERVKRLFSLDRMVETTFESYERVLS